MNKDNAVPTNDYKAHLIDTYQLVRKQTEVLCQPLAIEDYVIQSLEEVSPPKWHLAHTTWFFETFILKPHLLKFQIYHPLYQQLFNSYYQTVGNPYPRPRRGLLSRPTVENIYCYRAYVDRCILDCIYESSAEKLATIASLLTLGCHHEQQHQELLLMDIKHNFSIHPDFPEYQPRKTPSQANAEEPTLSSRAKARDPVSFPPITFHDVPAGIVEIGHQGSEFCFDNELPRHPFILNPYAMASRLVTNNEYCEFIAAGGYEKANYWLADAWDCVQKNNWQAPLYWHKIEGCWYEFTLHGLKELNPHEPVSHVSFYEAEAYARFCGMRLPTEIEWEHYVAHSKMTKASGHFLEKNLLHPQVAQGTTAQQYFGDLWEWTASAYLPYPAYQTHTGALGEYNGKFMSNQFVLRGGSCITPQSHIRATYRNFFQPDKRWAFTGIRLAATGGLSS